MKYILYCRKSSEDKGKQILSLESQVTEMKKLAVNLGLEIIKVYTESKSAKKPDNRPLFSEMIKQIKQNKNDDLGILCWKIDRLSRNPIDSATIQWLLQQGNIKIIQTIDRQYLPSDNVVMFSVESGMANQYILDLSKNVKRGILTKLEKGGWPNLAPLGYLNDGKGGIVIDKARSKYIEKMFMLYNEGDKSVKEISDILFKQGFRSRAGHKYHKSKVHKILNDSFYCGIMTKNGKQYLGNHEPIISKKLFDSVQDVLNKKANTKKQKLYFTYRGVLKCDTCGCVLTATKKKGKHTYYYCTNGKGKCDEHKVYLKENDVTNELTNIFDNVIISEKMIDLCYQASKVKMGKTNNYLTQTSQTLEDNLAKAENRKNKLLDLYLDGNLTKEVYDQKVIALDNEIVQLKKDLDELKQKKATNNEITLERIKDVFLYPIKAKKDFESTKNGEQEKIVKTLLWNAQMRNKKIANLTFKEPFNILSKIEDKSDFLSVRRDRDSNPRKV
ncbi:MAG: recombinase family protein [Patescibacteria group bacterium]|nr:recombinase family protein [Patescibacteria group bacterium]